MSASDNAGPRPGSLHGQTSIQMPPPSVMAKEGMHLSKSTYHFSTPRTTCFSSKIVDLERLARFSSPHHGAAHAPTRNEPEKDDLQNVADEPHVSRQTPQGIRRLEIKIFLKGLQTIFFSAFKNTSLSSAVPTETRMKLGMSHELPSRTKISFSKSARTIGRARCFMSTAGTLSS